MAANSGNTEYIMIEIDGKIVSSEIITSKFLCDLSRCRGICCVEGNAGAPLDEAEAATLADEYASFKPYMTREGVEAVENQGFSVIDADGDLVTPLVGDAQCAFSFNEDGVTLCAVEKAWAEGKCTFRKPISCHLYPIRVVRFGNGTFGLNYHRWGVCSWAGELGREKGVPVYRMLREAIVRRFGEEFYRALEEAEKYLSEAR